MNDDQRTLAHAAHDGELTPEELLRAEADPEVAAEIERLAAVRTGLRAVEPLPPARRAAMLAAAVDAFDTGEPADAARTAVAPPPASAPAGRRQARWLLPVAAAALVGVAAVGAIVGSGSSDDERSGAGQAGDAVLEAPAGAELDSTEQTLSLEDATASVAADDLQVTFGTVLADDPLATASLAVVRTPDELAAYATAAEAADVEAPSVDASVPTTSAGLGTADAPADTAGAGQTEAADATVAARAGESSATGPTCPVDGHYLGTVLYGADPATAVVVDVVRRGDAVLAVAVEGCVEVAVAPGR